MEPRNIALRLSYTGTAYHGWQVQKNAVTVEIGRASCRERV